MRCPGNDVLQEAGGSVANPVHYCGGTLVAPNLVLTGSHVCAQLRTCLRTAACETAACACSLLSAVSRIHFAADAFTLLKLPGYWLAA